MLEGNLLNDENARPCELNERPNDADRARFGFKHPVPTASTKLRAPALPVPKLTPPGTSEPAPHSRSMERLASAAPPGPLEHSRSMERLASVAPLRPTSVATAAADIEDPAKLLSVVDEQLGDQEADLALVRQKMRSGRYDFKDQIEELKSQVTPLKTALSERVRRERAMRDGLVKHVDGICRMVSSIDAQLAEQRRAHEDKLGKERERHARESADWKAKEVDIEKIWQNRERLQKQGFAEREAKTKQIHDEEISEWARRLQANKDDNKRRSDEAAAKLESAIAESNQKIEKREAEHAMELAERDLRAAQREEELELRLSQQVTQSNKNLEDLRSALTQEFDSERQQMQLREGELRDQLVQSANEAELREQELDAEHAQRENHLRATASQREAELQAEIKRALAAASQREQELEGKHSKAMQEAKVLQAKQKAELQAEVAQAVADAEGRQRDLEARFKQREAELEAELSRITAEAKCREQSLDAEHGAALSQAASEFARREADIHVQLDKVKTDARRREQELELERTSKLEQLEAQFREHEREMMVDAATKLTQAESRAQQREHELVAKLEQQTVQSQQRASELKMELEASASSARSREHELSVDLRGAEVRAQKLREDLDFARDQERKLQQEVLEASNKLRRVEVELATEKSFRDHETSAKAALHAEHMALVNAEAQQRAALQELQTQLSAAKAGSAELQRELRTSEADREKLRDAVAEEQSNLQIRAEELVQVSRRLAGTLEELATANAELTTLREKTKRLSIGRRELEIEYTSYKENHCTSNAAQMEAITELKVTVDKLNQKVDSTQMELGAKSTESAQHLSSLRHLQEQLVLAEASRRELHNAIQELRGNIRVLCRIRPGSPGTASSLTVEENKVALAHSGETYPFSFDKVFNPSMGQEDVFTEVSGLIQSALDGYKVCIFAYGQTGSGKTYTMQGGSEPSSWGLIPRSLRQIFAVSNEMRAKGWQWTLRASFMEVYNEVLRDLIRDDSAAANHRTGSPGASTQLYHTIKHDADWGMTVTNMTCVPVDSMEEINSLIARAAKSRAVGSTDMNSVSSRSHSIFSLYLSGSNTNLDTELRGALHLVDLAGSERLDKSGAVGDRLKETQNINRSLSSLADVFAAKAEGRSHVPFRNSKLTHLMEPCLSGHGKTLMAVNIGPETDNSHETLCSLRFASQVSQCTTGGKPKRSAKTLAKPSSSSAAVSSSNRRGGC
eukprot:TRINITY_DN16535_c0_g2_i2.p1 TRINITY_DN16535_c0_g2~~TRINITY_DN16535_c0_g2_i2.p1  ORF type:complete len:1215 (+),score=315.60 TRINITY_DN16535_c0_g2_i2:93-3737(+)